MVIKSGTVEFHKNDDPSMNTGNGPRTYHRHVNFGARLKKTPKVVTSITGMDVYNSANARISVNAENVTDDSCDIRVHTWADTKIWSLTVSWIAYDE